MLIGVVQLPHRDIEAPQRLDARAIVVEGAGLAARLAARVKGPANRHVACAEYQRMLAIGDGLCPDVDPPAPGYHRCDSVFGAIDERAHADRNMIAIDAARTKVTQRGCLDDGFLPVNQAAIGERIGGDERGVALGGDKAAVIDIAARAKARVA